MRVTPLVSDSTLHQSPPSPWFLFSFQTIRVAIESLEKISTVSNEKNITGSDEFRSAILGRAHWSKGPQVAYITGLLQECSVHPATDRQKVSLQGNSLLKTLLIKNSAHGSLQSKEVNTHYLYNLNWRSAVPSREAKTSWASENLTAIR